MPEIFEKYYQIFEGLKELLELYKEINLRVDKFKQDTGINCLHLCGRCCNTSSSNIEASVFELFPLAIYLWENKKIEAVINELNTIDESAPCIFFKHNKIFNETGNCSMYELRPLICRLFGFSVLIDKEEKVRYISCNEMKKKLGDRIVKIESCNKSNSDLLILPDFAQRATALNYQYGRERFDINKALKKALEIVALKLSFISHDDDGSDNPFNNSPKRPPFRRCA